MERIGPSLDYIEATTMGPLICAVDYVKRNGRECKHYAKDMRAVMLRHDS